MSVNVTREVAALQRMTTKQLLERYAEVFGEQTNGRNKAWLVKRIAWRLQANAEGRLSERARHRASELANDADLRLNPPRVKAVRPAEDAPPVQVLKFQTDDRLPPPGTILTREYKGGTVQVKVTATGFEYEGMAYGSLSAVAKAITGSHCNGFLFFKLNAGAKGGKP
jgi:hypothetical protein